MTADDVLAGRRLWSAEQGDALAWLAALPPASVDLVMCSPPYERARTYAEGGEDPGIARGTEEWVLWLVPVFRAALRACRGLVCMVVEGQTQRYRWSAGPALLMADLHRAGVCLRRPPAYRRNGIPGSGGPDWLRNDMETIICATNGGRLPWSDNTACGHPPKYGPGGECSNRKGDGTRVNQWGGNDSSGGSRRKGGSRQAKPRPSHIITRVRDGMHAQTRGYTPPALANPGNVIECKVGGNHLGDPLAHANEAPYPESLPAFFVRSFAPPDGIVCDPFLGSGTTLAAALKWGRRGIGCDLRESQVQLSRRRLGGLMPLFDHAAESPQGG